MDIFVRNIPDQADSRSLEKFFRNQLRHFGIEVLACQKFKNKRLGVVTALDAEKVWCFLSIYGTPTPRFHFRTESRPLRYMGKKLFCSPSTNEPEKQLLKTLQQETKDRKSYKRKAEPIDKLARQYEYTSIQCGVFEYLKSDLIFVPHASCEGKGWIKFGRKSLALVADYDSTTSQLYRLDVTYSAIHSITMGNSSRPSIDLTVYEAPRAYYLPPLTLGPAEKAKRSRVPGLWPNQDLMNWCYVYRLEMLEPREMRSIDQLLQQGREMPSNIRWPTSVLYPKSAISKDMDELVATLYKLSSLEFGVKFQLQRLAQNGILSPNIVQRLLPHVEQLSRRSGAFAAAEAVQNLHRQVPFAGPDTEATEFAIGNLQEQIDKYNRGFRREEAHRRHFEETHPHIVFVHRAEITPAGLYLKGPEQETSNRVLRAYPHHVNWFIRVTFCEEDGQQIHFDSNVSLSPIFNSRFKKIMDHGFQIAGRRFAFLGFSHSSLRDHTCWFMAPFVYEGNVLDADKVITELGDFSSIRSPAKCAARIGQAFSTTDGAVNIPPEIIGCIPDVERNGRVFSDGVGIMSADVLALIWRDYRPARESYPTLYQIRLAGAKGMISLDKRLKGKVLLLRQSMIKFTGSKISDIEICGSASRALPMYLNRQLIKIMEDLGVAPSNFLELQSHAVERLRNTTRSSANAADFLERENTGKVCRIPWLIRKLHSLGLEFLEDPFLRKVVELTVLSQLRDLKHRSRILVKHGTTLYGIMDETDTLADGEVYCSMAKTALLGRVAITRSPALHPGDVQIAQAVAVPKTSPLNCLHNCVVFSQRGARDLPSQLSGGDLDGDLYNVIYDPRLLPARVVEPADYKRVTPKDIGREVTRKDMTDFFIDFMENDQLGRIATLHVQLADRETGGTQHPKCKALAEMHSTAVDFSKTGIAVDMSKMPKHDRCRPDFMAPSPRVTIEKSSWNILESPPPNIAEEQEDLVQDLDPDRKGYRYYESENVLGELYRAIDEKEFLAGIQERARDIEATSLSRDPLMYRLWSYVQLETQGIQWTHYREWAHDVQESYETRLIDVIYEYSSHSVLISELEVFVGTLLGKDGGVRTKRLRDMSMNMKESFERDLAFTISCIVQGSDAPFGDGEEAALERSIACLAVAVDGPPRTWGKVKRLESFRYVAAMVCLTQLERFLGHVVF